MSSIERECAWVLGQSDDTPQGTKCGMPATHLLDGEKPLCRGHARQVNDYLAADQHRLESIFTPTGRRWTAVECARATGMTTEQGWRSTVNAARRARATGATHWAPDPVGHDPHTGLLVWDADAVTAGHHARPRRGPRPRTE